MAFARPETLILAALVDSPALWGAFVTHDMPVSTALLRFLIAVPVCALMVAGLHWLTGGYERLQADAREAEELAAEAEQELMSAATPGGLDRRQTD